jgi:hypothetical protein
MARRKLEEHNIRKLMKLGETSYVISIPIEMVREMDWKKKQKLVVTRYGDGIMIRELEEK